MSRLGCGVSSSGHRAGKLGLEFTALGFGLSRVGFKVQCSVWRRGSGL